MEIDHIFIFTNQGKETDELVQFGWTEGSGRRHEGIGTANRRFFFENFYLEILWVQEPDEAQSVDKLDIWERSNHRENDYSRFGLCLKNTPATDVIFQQAMEWKPDFLEGGKRVDILTNRRMPWIFRFPPRDAAKSEDLTPHRNGIGKLTKAVFGLPFLDFEKEISVLRSQSIVDFVPSNDENLMLEFDHGQQGKTVYFDGLSLTVDY